MERYVQFIIQPIIHSYLGYIIWPY